MNPITVNLQIQYDMSEALILPDQDYHQTRLTVLSHKRAADGEMERSYGSAEGRIKSIDIYSIDDNGHLLDKQNNIIYTPDSADSIPLQLDNPKVYAATWRENTNQSHFRPIIIN